MKGAVFQAQNAYSGERVCGTARDLSGALGYRADTIRDLAKTGGRSRAGWEFHIIRPAGADEYIATNPAEDPIIGPVEEIAALTGMHPSSVLYLIHTGATSRGGWTVKTVGRGKTIA